MWHALRAELAYFRPFLAFAWAIALAVALMVNVMTLLAADEGHPGIVIAAGLPGIFLVIASMIVGFIAQGTRSEERRARLLLAGALTPRHLAGVLVLLPACLVGLGTVAGLLLVGAASLITGQLEFASAVMVTAVAAQLFAVVQMGPLAQESSAAYRQGRSSSALAAWTVFVAAILAMALLESLSVATIRHLSLLGVAVVAAVLSAVLFAKRSDFTR